MKKKCKKCGIIKNVSEFSKSKNHKDGLYTYCKDCGNLITKKYYEKNIERRTETRKQWGEMNLGRLAEIARIYRKNHAERQAARNAVNDLVRRNKMKPAKEFMCSNCKIKKSKEYHHHKGYAKEHYLDVIPLCRECHVEIDKGVSVRPK